MFGTLRLRIVTGAMKSEKKILSLSLLMLFLCRRHQMTSFLDAFRVLSAPVLFDVRPIRNCSILSDTRIFFVVRVQFCLQGLAKMDEKLFFFVTHSIEPRDDKCCCVIAYLLTEQNEEKRKKCAMQKTTKIGDDHFLSFFIFWCFIRYQSAFISAVSFMRLDAVRIIDHFFLSVDCHH